MDFGLIYTHFQLEDTFYLLQWDLGFGVIDLIRSFNDGFDLNLSFPNRVDTNGRSCIEENFTRKTEIYRSWSYPEREASIMWINSFITFG